MITSDWFERFRVFNLDWIALAFMRPAMGEMTPELPQHSRAFTSSLFSLCHVSHNTAPYTE